MNVFDAAVLAVMCVRNMEADAGGAMYPTALHMQHLIAAIQRMHAAGCRFDEEQLYNLVFVDEDAMREEFSKYDGWPEFDRVMTDIFDYLPETVVATPSSSTMPGVITFKDMDADEFSAWLRKHYACSRARAWADGHTMAWAWANCEDPIWLWWLVDRLSPTETVVFDEVNREDDNLCLLSTKFQDSYGPRLALWRSHYTVVAK